MNRDILNQDPELAIAAYRDLLTGHGHEPMIALEIPVVPSRNGIWADHGVHSVTELLALAIASRIASAADSAHIGEQTGRIPGELDEEIGVEITEVLTQLRDTLRTRFRPHLQDRASLGYERIAALAPDHVPDPDPVYDDMDDDPF